ncbi:hypothetical protein [Ferruginibacter albus]|uniref:hypothetical protein n=1 Tax=Ferruginibacter albus TaxID=2875540 RepID=UPI001CC3892A|nr:hypothetical protein [Ferruginibacter albus]UAY52289.1 hypothetical protein K9M53_01010 [Ferruginibacter albus]
MKKLLVACCMLFFAYNVNAQMYGGYNLGLAFRPGMSNSPLMNLRFGYQFNEVFDPNGLIVAEYDQRSFTGGVSPFYLGGRVGYGWNTGENTTFILSGGGYYRFLSSSEKADGNYWIGGYGLTFLYKNLSVEVSKVEFYQAAIGCHYYFD